MTLDPADRSLFSWTASNDGGAWCWATVWMDRYSVKGKGIRHIADVLHRHLGWTVATTVGWGGGDDRKDDLVRVSVRVLRSTLHQRPDPEPELEPEPPPQLVACEYHGSVGRLYTFEWHGVTPLQPDDVVLVPGRTGSQLATVCEVDVSAPLRDGNPIILSCVRTAIRGKVLV